MYLTGHSLTEGCLPASQKRAIVFPTLKKQNLDQNACQNYRPISNLSFLSKTLERLVSLQLLPYFEQAGLLPAAQSGFRGHHSTETALLSLLSDIYVAIDQSHLSLLALLTSLPLLIWWITRFCFSDYSYPVAFLVFPFFGLNPISLTARRWLSLETPALSGVGVN